MLSRGQLAVRTYGSISFALREELIVLAYQIWKPQFHSVVQFSFDNCHSPFSPTTFFEIGISFSRKFVLRTKDVCAIDLTRTKVEIRVSCGWMIN